DGGKLSSNGGVLILREIERKLGLAAVLSRHIPDDRDRTRITHSYSDMTRARMFAIASGHEDCDDLDVLRSDPVVAMDEAQRGGVDAVTQASTILGAIGEDMAEMAVAVGRADLRADHAVRSVAEFQLPRMARRSLSLPSSWATEINLQSRYPGDFDSE